jgi:hypothetical protein
MLGHHSQRLVQILPWNEGDALLDATSRTFT